MARTYTETLTEDIGPIDLPRLSAILKQIPEAFEVRLHVHNGVTEGKTVEEAASFVQPGERLESARAAFSKGAANQHLWLEWHPEGPLTATAQADDPDFPIEIISMVRQLVQGAPPSSHGDPAPPSRALAGIVLSVEARRSVEAVLTFWQSHGEELELPLEVSGLGDSLAAAGADILRHEHAPPSVLRTIVRWFAHKADIVIEEAAKSVGKMVGPGVGVYAAHKLHLWEELRDLAAAASDLTKP